MLIPIFEKMDTNAQIKLRKRNERLRNNSKIMGLCSIGPKRRNIHKEQGIDHIDPWAMWKS